jgi:hypothetical protein
METPYIVKRAHDEVPPEALSATDELLATFQRPRSRRGVLRLAALGAAGATAASLSAATALTALPVHAEAASGGVVTEILSLAATAESLAITFYNNGIAAHAELGINGWNFDSLRAVAYEEQVHRNFFIANGGKPATTTFSFPAGEKTFDDLDTFIETQQQLELVFDSAFLLAVKVFAQIGNPALAQIAAQIACVEEGHRVLGRILLGDAPAENNIFQPVFFSALSQIVPTVTAAGYLSPKPGNSFTYSPAPAVGGVLNDDPNDREGVENNPLQ